MIRPSGTSLAVAGSVLVASLSFAPSPYSQEAPPGFLAFERGEGLLAGGDAWEASKAFERALAEGYPAAEGYLRLADAYLALDNRLFDARRAIERSLKADSDRVAVWSRLADVNIEIDGLDAERRARRALREVVRIDPRYPDALSRWRSFYLEADDSRAMAAILATHLGRRFDPELAIERIDILDEIGAFAAAREAILDMRQHSSARTYGAVLQYYAGVIDAAEGEPESGWSRYRSGLEAATEAWSLRPYLRDLAPLLPVATVEGWKKLPVEARREILIGWWNARDVRPATPLNERWVEQQRRIRFARRTFGFKKAWRLERLLALDASAFGRPSLAIRHGGRPMDDRAEIYLRHGHPDAQGNVGRDECGFWYYARGDRDSTATFAVNFLQPDAFDPRVRFLGNDCLYSQLPTTPEGLAHFAPGGLRFLDRPRVLERTDRELEVALSTDSQRDEVLDPIEVRVTPARFLDVAGKPELAVYVAARREELGRGARRVVVVFDERWIEVGRDVDALDAGGGATVGRFVSDVARFALPFGEYHIAVEVADSIRYGVERDGIAFERRVRDRLMMSDVLVTAQIATSSEEFLRRGRVVVPDPRGAHDRGTSLRLYYEVYAEVGDSLRVEYTIGAESLDRGAVRAVFGALAGLVGIQEEAQAVTFAFERVAAEGTFAEEISIDTLELAAGDYTVDVAVSSPAGDVAERQVGFTLR